MLLKPTYSRHPSYLRRAWSVTLSPRCRMDLPKSLVRTVQAVFDHTRTAKLSSARPTDLICDCQTPLVTLRSITRVLMIWTQHWKRCTAKIRYFGYLCNLTHPHHWQRCSTSAAQYMSVWYCLWLQTAQWILIWNHPPESRTGSVCSSADVYRSKYNISPRYLLSNRAVTFRK